MIPATEMPSSSERLPPPPAPSRARGRFRRGLGRVRPSRFSLRSRVLTTAIALVACALAVSATFVTGALRGYLTDQVDRQLALAARQLSHAGGERTADGTGGSGVFTPGGGSTGPGSGTGTGGGNGNGTLFPRPRVNVLPSRVVAEYLNEDGTTRDRLRSPGSEAEKGPRLPRLDGTAVRDRDRAPFEARSAEGEGRWRVLAVPMSNGSGSVVVATSLHDVDATVARMDMLCLVVGLVSVAVLGGAGWFAIRASLRPLRRIEETAAAIAAGDLSHRVPVPVTGTEVGRLSGSLNGMLAQIESGFAARAESEARMRRFVADAGHELRTPLASVRGFAELYRMGALSDPDEVARTMRRIEDEAVRMGGLVEDLLQLARLDEQRPLRREPLDLRVLAGDAVHDIETLAADRPVTLSGRDGRPARAVVVPGDEARLRQVMGNLVTNALTHTPPGTAIHIVVDSEDGYGYVEVADEGPGLDEVHAARVFERFYRVDSSRSRGSGGGSGLGLAIVDALVTRHGGRVELRSGVGRGAAFRVLLPLVPPS